MSVVLKLKQQYFLPLVLILMTLLGGIVIAQAVRPSASFEAESGTESGQAVTASDSSASNGQYLGFNSLGAPGAAQFFEDFMTDQRSRFDWQLQTTAEPPQTSFMGEHNANTPCGTASTYRTVHPVALQSGVAHTKVDITNSELIWWCAENNDPAKGHIMTGLDSGSIAAISFSPKQAYSNVKKVCWDQSMINVGDGRWLNVFIVPNSDVVSKNNDLAYIAGASMTFHSGNQMLPPGAVDFSWKRGTVDSNKIYPDGSYHEDFNVWMSIDPQDDNGNGEIDPGDTPTKGMATDPEKLFTICVDDVSNKVTIERPNGDFDTYDYNIAFPTGSVRVIFQDALKTPSKYISAKHMTWHWDNISID